jgi:hypothetical protein
MNRNQASPNTKDEHFASHSYVLLLGSFYWAIHGASLQGLIAHAITKGKDFKVHNLSNNAKRWGLPNY